MTTSDHEGTSLYMNIVLALLVPFLTVTAVSQANAENLQEIAQRTHFHGVSFNRAGGDAELVLATHHGMFAVMKDGSAVQMSATQDFMGFSADPSDPLKYFGSGHPADGGNSGFLETRDGGANWSKRSDGINGPVDFHGLAVSAVDPKVIYGVFDGIQMSSDGGVTWQITGTLPDGFVQLAASSESSRRIFAAMQGGLKVSNDSGQTWSSAAFDGEIVSAVRMTASGTAYAFVLGRGFLSSKEANMIDWATLSGSFGDAIPLHVAVHPRDSDRMVVTTQSNEVFESRDGGRNWKPFGQPQ